MTARSLYIKFKTLCWRQIKAWLTFSVCVDVYQNFDIVYFLILTFLCKKEMGPIVTWLTSFLLSFMWEPPGGMPPSKGVPVATKDCTEISHKKTNTFLKRQMIRKKTNIAQKDKRLRWNIGIWIRSRNTKGIRSYISYYCLKQYLTYQCLFLGQGHLSCRTVLKIELGHGQHLGGWFCFHDI